MEKNREAFMALWNEYVKGRKGDKAVLRYLEEAGFFTSPASTKHHGAFPGGLCYHSVNVAAEVLGLLAQHQLEDEKHERQRRNLRPAARHLQGGHISANHKAPARPRRQVAGRARL